MRGLWTAACALGAVALLLAPGCKVDVPIFITQESMQQLQSCGTCASEPGGAEPEMPSDALVDTIVISTFRPSGQTDCRSCQNPVASSGVFLPPPDPEGDMSGREPGWTCTYADFFSEALRACSGVRR